MTTVQKASEVDYKQAPASSSVSNNNNNGNICAQTAKSPGIGSVMPETWNKIPKKIQEVFTHECEYRFLESGAVTFHPSPFLPKSEYATKVLPKEKLFGSQQMKDFLSKLQCNAIESMYDWDAEIVCKPDVNHCFLRACEIAFFQHYPLSISPSDIWLVILHGIAAHIDCHSELLRDNFVSHQGKMALTVKRPSFVKGSKANDWQSVIEEFVQQIDKNTVQETAKLLECDFSSSSLMDVVAGKVSIMDICKHYFTYTLLGGCGFPQITLNGTKEDWVSLKAKITEILKTKVEPGFGEKWAQSLLPLIDRFIVVYDGIIDCVFWNSMIKRGGMGSGGVHAAWGQVTDQSTFYSGWVNILFPYLMHRIGFTRNRSCVPYDMSAEYVIHGFRMGSRKSMSMRSLPCGLSSAPVEYKDLNTNTEYQLKFAAGFMGVDQNSKTLEISPKIGWVVAENVDLY